jgi:putative DNA primase/helicase
MTYNEEDLFKLSSGRYILDNRISDIMQKLYNIRPERAWQDDSTGYSWDEAGMADLFSELYEHDTRFCPERKSWYTYEGGRWQKDVGSLLISAKIKEFVRILSLYCGEIVDEDIRKKYMSFVTKMGDRRFRDRIMKDAADSMRITAETFDSDPYLINCTNGTFDLKEMTFREHSWTDFITLQTRFEGTMKFEDISCPRWETFIGEVTQGDLDKAEYLQRALGYSILGTSKEECMFILHGKSTRNGKSTLLNTIEYMLGDYSTAAPVNLICKGNKGGAESANPVLASLKAKRFVTMAESDDAGKLDESAIKQYTGGESITARELYQAPITFVPQFTLWLSCNDLPAVRDKSLFASNRLRLIEFNRHFTEAEQDKNLKAELEDPKNMQGIFSWLLAGYLKYLRYGLELPESMKAPVKKYERDNDVVLQFLEENCEYDTDEKVRVKTAYDQYKIWSRSNGFLTMSIRKFTAEMDKHPDFYDYKAEGTGHATYYFGMKLV